MNDNSTEEIFSEISRLADDMCEYTYSVVFNSYNPEFEVRDALRVHSLRRFITASLPVETSATKVNLFYY